MPDWKNTEVNEIIFELGRYYEHSGGSRIHIIALARTRMHGLTLLAESRADGSITTVGTFKENTVNYEEITKKRFEADIPPKSNGATLNN